MFRREIMKEIIKDILNILKISLFMLYFSSLYVCIKLGKFDLSILKSIYEVTIEYFIPYNLPLLFFFLFLL